MLSRFRRKPKIAGLSAVALAPKGFALVHSVRDHSGRPRLEVCEQRTCAAASEVPAALASAVREHGLQGADCVGVLRADLYSLRQIDAPAVPSEEQREAARWAIKDLVEFPVGDAVIDVFEVPSGDIARKRRVYVVATPRAVVQGTVDVISQSGLSLVAIDIEELALRNVAMLLPEDQRGVALVAVQEGSGPVVITQRGTLFLTRRLPIDLEVLGESAGLEAGEPKPDVSEETRGALESLLLELQRSLDFYDHQLGQPPVSAVVLAPSEIQLDGVRAYLEQSLGTGIVALDLSSVIESRPSLPQTLQARCLTAIGGSLRSESEPA